MNYKSGYVTIQMDGKPFYVRYTVLIDGPEETAATATKETLVLVHGYMCGGVSAFVQWFKYL